jgi:OOP family OmpA-OmpF porin
MAGRESLHLRTAAYTRTNMSKLAHVCAVLALLVAVSHTRAQQRGYAINMLELSERGSEWFAADSLDLRGHQRLAVGLVGEWAYRPLTARNAEDDYILAIVRNQFVLHPGASLVLTDRVRVAIDVPVQAFADGRGATVAGSTIAPPAEGASLGDIRLAADVRIFGTYGEVITGAVGLQLSLPTGDKDAYAGDGQTRITPHFLLAGDIGPFVYAARLGVTIRPDTNRFANTYVDSNLAYALAAGVRVLDRKLVIGPELFAHTSLTHKQFFKQRSTPTELLLGAHYMVVNGLRLGAGIGFGLTSGYGAPEHRVLLSLEWAPVIASAAPPPASDRDVDGIEDARDACPDQPGPAASDPSQNGCPTAPADRDSDGVPDSTDACPDQPGVTSANAAANGCPPPPPDTDKDGVLDAADACPNDAGVSNADRSKNGCPAAKDSDSDGVLDAVDACPTDAGPTDTDPKRNGCPKAFVQGTQIKILDQVKFQTNKADILPGKESEDVLLAVQKVLTEHTEIRAVRIEGHTDNTGAAEHNRELSKQRAQAVLDWLVKHGIEASRLTAEGFGPDRPLDANTTEDGRRNNRRVDFQIAPTAEAK